ncbi:MAG TPA: hypothetical protein VLW55_12690 [Burkholderiaceae bacterium]|nr:hypothetical protein [Burkholderiaceae bacterium]
MDKTRRKLLFASAGGAAFVAVLASCGGGGGYSGPAPAPVPPPPPGTLACHDTLITGNHGHAVTIPTADLDSMVDMTYNIQGTADHNHTITLTPAQLQMIKAMTATSIMSSTNLSHNHDVTVNCA